MNNSILVPMASPGSWATLSWISDLNDTEQKIIAGACVAILLLVLVMTVWCICLFRWRRRLLKQTMEIVASHAARPAITNTADAGSAPPSPMIKVTSASDTGLETGGGVGVKNCQHTFRFTDTSKVVVEAGERFVIVQMVRPEEVVMVQEDCSAPGGLPEPGFA
ncbi:hypothetical protein BG006_006670 [Podila minutissima]|uniref:Uncharacterized protein n=1 Tax=Podila minutissima TaxID=64525 RepID=A0A9P5SIE7_9FUNG|nr:hypothetical protein BG006_006670 [Podila minutissima]